MPRSHSIQLRRGTDAEWTASDPILRDGEPGYVTDTGMMKVGDGVSAWSDLYSVGVLTPHDALYSYPASWQTNGTPVASAGDDDTLPRVTLDVGQRIKFVWAIPVGWDAVAVRWASIREIATTGTVAWQLAYKLIYLTTNDVDAAGTDIAVPAGSVGGQFAFAYNTPAETAAIATPTGVFSDKPFMEVSLSRTGGTLGAGGISVPLVTATRVDL